MRMWLVLLFTMKIYTRNPVVSWRFDRSTCDSHCQLQQLEADIESECAEVRSLVELTCWDVRVTCQMK
jgi:hypothetical protein